VQEDADGVLLHAQRVIVVAAVARDPALQMDMRERTLVGPPNYAMSSRQRPTEVFTPPLPSAGTGLEACIPLTVVQVLLRSVTRSIVPIPWQQNESTSSLATHLSKYASHAPPPRSTSAHCVSSRVYRALHTSSVCLVLCSCSSNTLHSTSTSILFVRGLWLCLLASPACDSVMTPHSHPILSLPAPRYPLLCTTCTRYFR